MGRDWKSEQAEVEAEVRAAKEALDAVRGPASPELGNTRKTVSTGDLGAFGDASRRFEAATARQSAFLAERKARDPDWGGAV